MRSHALFRITPYVKRHKGKLLFAIAVAFVEIIAEAQIPLVIKDAINGPVRDASERHLLWPMIAMIVALGTIETSLAFARRMLLARASYSVEMELRNDLYAHLQRLHVSFHDGWQSGQLLSRAINDINSIRRFVGFALPFLVILSFQFVYIIVRLFGLNFQLAAISTLGILPVGYISYYFGKRYRVIARQVQDDQGDLGTVIEEAATGIRIIKAFGRRPAIQEKFGKQAEKLRQSNMGWVRLSARTWPTFDIFPNFTSVAVLIFGGMAVIRGTADFQIGELVAFILLVRQLVWPVDALGWILAMTEESRTATERIHEVLDTKPSIQDRPGAGELHESDGEISLEGVWFRYDEARDWVLKDVDLELRAGETMALVGKTGCGKTSLAMLIPRLYDVNQGRVALDGRDIRDVKVDSLRRHIGVAFEDPILFSASVKENLVMGRPDATDEEMAKALRTAKADFVYDLPWGLDTRVGEQGHTLSGGQRQRLALARAILGGPQVLVLDDPLSSVDVHTEEQIEQALESVLSGVTAILVVHRPSTLKLADRVALMDEGTIVAVGTHHELMESNDLYKAILSQEAELLDDETDVTVGT
ncbi:MAG: ABC transporter ATP-binding protein/permease [Actinobacteria bacterium]|nr:ABC transporter ATP-binding protein/permease [Actinomycetota bacterium]